MAQLESSPGGNRERILSLLLHAPGPISIPALATQLGISRNATHQHVSALERDGLIERAAQISTRGRPSQGFRLSAAGEALFPRQYALLARKLVGELANLLGADVLPAVLARIGEGIAGELAPRLAASAEGRIPSIAAPSSASRRSVRSTGRCRVTVTDGNVTGGNSQGDLVEVVGGHALPQIHARRSGQQSAARFRHLDHVGRVEMGLLRVGRGPLLDEQQAAGMGDRGHEIDVAAPVVTSGNDDVLRQNAEQLGQRGLVFGVEAKRHHGQFDFVSHGVTLPV